jgi:putative methyltransferase (TIGR04325 family)
MRIFDFGGANGIGFYASREYMKFPPGLDWTVCDVKKVIDAGEQMATGKNAPGLHFTEDFKQCDQADLLVSSGALQYVEAGIADMLGTLSSLPSYILLNRIPVWDREPLFTLQTINDIVCPYRIFNRSQFVGALERLGYRLMDEWDCPESTFSVRFRPALRLDAYHGFYFALPAHPVESVFRSSEGQHEPGTGNDKHKQQDLVEAELSYGGS